MSRRRGEFEHRTSIFEGAFRAWSHLGGLDPLQLESGAVASDLDPLTNPIVNDERLKSNHHHHHNNNSNYSSSSSSQFSNADGQQQQQARHEYPYEPLPRAGLSHPYVQAILSPWLGPDADHEAIQLGLTTLRTWWQHRRKGESGSAIAALGTEKMRGVVEGYTRHFFTLAHCLIVNDREQPPRTLHNKMKELEKARKKQKANKRSGGVGTASTTTTTTTTAGGLLSLQSGAAAGDETKNVSSTIASMASAMQQQVDSDLVASLTADLTDDSLTPLERLHAAQRRQLAEAANASGASGTVGTTTLSSNDLSGVAGGVGTTTPLIDIKGKCIPGKIDLPGVVDAVNRHATQLAHRGGNAFLGTAAAAVAPENSTSSSTSAMAQTNTTTDPSNANAYGDPNTTPVVFVSSNGDIQIAMTVNGITCAHCVKIVETVLIGCNGNKSPIDGLLDAAADRVLNSVLIKIDKASNAKRIAFEAARNLAMVGYTSKAKEMNIVGQGADKKVTMDLGSLSTAFEVVANTETKDVFDWTISCTCPDNGVLRTDCARHSQMNTRIFDAFDLREKQVTEYMAGCAMRFGMPCTCGPDCRCKNCPSHSGQQQQQQQQQEQTAALTDAELMPAPLDPFVGHPMQVDQPMDFTFGMDPPAVPAPPPMPLVPDPAVAAEGAPPAAAPSLNEGNSRGGAQQRNPSIISYGNGLRHMSITSETTFGRAMSGLSALSIDWENLEDFDLELDHSAHIQGAAAAAASPTKNSGPSSSGPRRSSLRRSFMSTTGGDRDETNPSNAFAPHVTFRTKD